MPRFLPASLIAFALATPHAARAQDSGDESTIRIVGESLAASLGPDWTVTSDDAGMVLRAAFAGWPLRGYCLVDLPEEDRARLRRVSDALEELRGLARERGLRFELRAAISGQSDRVKFRRDSPLGSYSCAGVTDSPVVNVDVEDDDNLRLALYRAITVEVELVRIARGRADADPLDVQDIEYADPKLAHERSPTARRADLEIRIVTVTLPPPDPPPLPPDPPEGGPPRAPAPSPVEVSTKARELSIAKDVRPRRAVAVGASAGILAPLSAGARRADFGLNGLGILAVRVVPSSTPWCAVLGLGFVARRPDGEIVLNDRSEHYATTLVGIGVVAEPQLEREGSWIGAGPSLRLIYVQRHIILNSSERDQDAASLAGGVQVDGAWKISGRLSLWASLALDIMVLEVAGGVSNPATGHATLGLMYYP